MCRVGGYAIVRCDPADVQRAASVESCVVLCAGGGGGIPEFLMQNVRIRAKP